MQGSALGPASYTVHHTTTTGNRIFKFADDTYLVVPDTNASSCLTDIIHIEAWATSNIAAQ